MAKKSRREQPAVSSAVTPTASTMSVRPSVQRRSRKASFSEEFQYTYVRKDLIRIGLLAFSLFAALILLRVLATAFQVIP